MKNIDFTDFFNVFLSGATIGWCFFLQTPMATIENPRGKAHPLSGTPRARRA